MEPIYLTIALAPLAAAVVAGLFGKAIGKAGAHGVTILAVGVSCVLSFYVLYRILFEGQAPFNGTVYTWLVSDGVTMDVGFLIDRLSAMMMVVVTFVSLMVHIYTVGYMDEDPGYQRFFSYISLFTFSMLMLVMSNNFVQLFFGWEAVGVVSYLLIGFWYTRPTAIFANLKAFLVNRVGDFGFVLGIAAVLRYTGSLDYATVFAHADQIAAAQIHVSSTVVWPAITFTCICLFIGAMGKSAQVPLHVWLPDSMEGPTPISALIHAATMVTAGIFMVARMSPLFELSETALSVVLIIGSTTAFFMGLLGIVNNDIKRVVAYSTLSQLGYMTVALGVSAYGAGIFHLMTHAFFKALLFLAAGSVIMAMHHEQDMRKMGGLYKYLPVTYAVMLIGTLSITGVGIPGLDLGFSGFYSKDAIIDAAYAAGRTDGVANFAFIAGLIAAGLTSFYSWRLIFMTFHGAPKWQEAGAHSHGHDEPPREAPWDMRVPLLLLALGAVAAGGIFAEQFIGPERDAFWRGAVFNLPGDRILDALKSVPPAVVWAPLVVTALGFGAAWYAYILRTGLGARLTRGPIWAFLYNKWYFDEIYHFIFVRGAEALGDLFWKGGDKALIDGLGPDGISAVSLAVGKATGRLQTGYVYHYAFVMLLGIAGLLSFALWAFR
jgi:NADH-quinone oxidoreductase subunit L